MTWYLRSGEREIGPLGEEALRALVGTGQITADSQLWRNGLSGWTAAAALPGVLGPRAATPPEPLAAVPSALPVVATGSVAAFELATPWRRYWARSLDMTMAMFLAAVSIGTIRPVLLSRANVFMGQGWAILPLLFPLSLVIDTVIYWALGNTPGKAIAGIKVLQDGGRGTLRAAAYLGRNFGVYFFGLGLGLPIVSLVTLIMSYRRAEAGKAATWERLSGSRVYAFFPAEARTWVTAATYVIAATALFEFGVHSQYNRARYTAGHPPPSILQQELTEAANRVNAGAPRMIDSITRLDGAQAGPGPLFTYEYTLTNLRVWQLSSRTLQILRWRLSSNVHQAVCRGGALKPLFRTGTRVRIEYRDRDGQELVMVSLSSADCGS